MIERLIDQPIAMDRVKKIDAELKLAASDQQNAWTGDWRLGTGDWISGLVV